MPIYAPKGTLRIVHVVLYVSLAYMALSSFIKIVTGQVPLYSLSLILLILAILPFLMQFLILVGIIKVVEETT